MYNSMKDREELNQLYTFDYLMFAEKRQHLSPIKTKYN